MATQSTTETKHAKHHEACTFFFSVHWSFGIKKALWRRILWVGWAQPGEGKQPEPGISRIVERERRRERERERKGASEWSDRWFRATGGSGTMSQTSVLLQTRLNADSCRFKSFGVFRARFQINQVWASKRQSYWHCRSIASWRAHFKETSFSRFSSTLYPREKTWKNGTVLLLAVASRHTGHWRRTAHDKTIYHLYHLTISHTLRLFLNQACPFKISSLTKVFETQLFGHISIRYVPVMLDTVAVHSQYRTYLIAIIVSILCNVYVKEIVA